MSGSIASSTLLSIYNNTFLQYLKYSETIGGIILEQSLYVDKVFRATLDLLQNLGKFKKPTNPLAEHYITEPLFREISEVVRFESKASDYIFQVTLVSKSIKIFEWIRERDAEKFVAKLQKYIQFYQQKASCEIETLGRTHFEWLKFWNETYEEFSIFIVNFFKNGIIWTGSATLPVGTVLGDSQIVQKNEMHQALLNDLNKGEVIKTVLRHTSVDHAQSLPKVFVQDEHKWFIQNQKDSHKDLILNTCRKEEDICISNCENCTVVVESFVNIIYLDICKSVTVLFRNAAKLEADNCVDCTLHCFEKISTMEFANSENCSIHLSDRSLDTAIVTTRCTGINVHFPFDDGVYKSYKISDRLTTKIVPNKGIQTFIRQ